MFGSIQIRNKIKVFISSRCGPDFKRYNVVRAELKKLIESTNIAEVYLFEDSGSSSQSAQQDYLYALDDSDICIFLIDNADDVTAPIMREITRAKSHPKKSLFLFCSENKKEATQVQKELMGASGSKYYTVENFNDFIQQGYQDLINDIIRIFKNYCQNRLADLEFEVLEKNEREKINTSFRSESLQKSNLRQIDKCKGYFANIFYPMEYKTEHTSEIDDYLKNFLKVIWEDKKIRDFNVGLLLDSLKKEMDNLLYQVVEIRWKAIQAYWLDDLEGVITYLKEALKLAKELVIPEWIIQDILIDIRNMENLQDKHKNQRRFELEAQLELNNMSKELFYPVLDRFEKNYYQEINKEYMKNQIQSAYTVRLGDNLQSYARDLANIYYTSCYYGSLSHILLMKERVISTVFRLCEDYDDWEFRVLLIKLSVLSEDDKKVKNLIKYFNNILGKLNAKDAMEIYDFTNTIPIMKERFKSKLHVFKQIGYYFSDEDYQKILNELINPIYQWIENDHREVFLGSIIIDSLTENRYRMDSNIIIEICIKILDKKLYRFFDNVFNLLGKMDFSNVENLNLAGIKNAIMECVKSETVVSNSKNELVNVLINLSKQVEEFSEEINILVQEKINGYEGKIYLLETTKFEDANYVMNFIKEIENHLENQGKNGVYSFRGHDSYGLVKRILYLNPEIMESSMFNRIFKVCDASIFASNLNYAEKISAIQLLTFLISKFNEYNLNSSIFYNKLIENKHEVFVAFEDNMSKHSQITLEFNLMLLKLSLGKIEVLDLIDIFSIINQESDFEKLESLKALKNILEKDVFKGLDYAVQTVLIQFILSLKGDENIDIRYYSNVILLKILTHKNKDLILTHLSKAMDYENVYIKSHIITSFDDIIEFDNEAAYTILKKSLLDNHYLVRKVANRYKHLIN